MIERGYNSALVALFYLIVTLALRMQTFGNPLLHIDEGFYLLVGDRMLHGAIAYVDIWDRKPVGLFLIYAAIRWLGGEGIIQYQCVAALSVAATAYLLYRLALRVSRRGPAVFGGLAYVCWVAMFDGDGGQTPIFYNVFMVAAAGLAMTVATRDARGNVVRGGTAMLLVGCAIQIKYNVIFEGAYFGLAMLWARRSNGAPAIVSTGLLWVVLALLPTALAFSAFAATGHGAAFDYANFVSIFERVADSHARQFKRLFIIIGIISPLLFVGYPAIRSRAKTGEALFVLGWLCAAALFFLLFGTYFPHYALPLLLPVAVVAAIGLDRIARPRAVAAAVLGVGAIASVTVSGVNIRSKGDYVTAKRLTAEFNPKDQACPFIFDGNPVLYFLSNSCLPSRFIFPSHLNAVIEAQAIGVDQRLEIRRIMRNRPQLVMTLEPHFVDENPRARATLDAELLAHYRAPTRLPYGKRTALFYRPK